MENPRDEFAPVLKQLMVRMNELERRLSVLEHRPQPSGTPPAPQAVPTLVASHPLKQLSHRRSDGAIAAVGKVFLGIAGAYVLRAVAESGAVPRTAIVIVALAYAASWLVWAVRIHPTASFAGTASAITAALIFAPMLWELTLHFHVLSAGESAAMLVVFVALASALAWKHRLTSVAWVGTFFPAATALMLLIATRDPAPFTLGLLLIALLTEVAGLCGRWRSLRPVVALVVDFAVLVLIMVYAGRTEIPPEYRPIGITALAALTSALFVIYGSGMAVSTVVLRRRIGIFEIGQGVAAFLLAIISIRRISHDAAVPEIGLFSLLLAGMCYLASFGRFDRVLQRRNYHVFAALGAALVLLGIFLFLENAAMALWLSLAAVVTTLVSMRSSHWVVGLHGAVYLAAAVYSSGLLAYMADMLAGSLPASPGHGAWVTALSAAICCAIVWSLDRDSGIALATSRWNERLLRLFLSSLTASLLAALLVAATVWLAPTQWQLAAPGLAVIRTFILCLIIATLSFIGFRRRHPELVWIAYGTIVLCTLKLLFEDLRYGTAGSLAVSLFLYGTIWILVPRLARSNTQRPDNKELVKDKETAHE
jgi:hypothetical protein